MKRVYIVLIAILMLLVVIVVAKKAITSFFYNTKHNLDLSENIKDNALMDLTSDAFDTNQTIPSQYSCDGDDVNPPLSIAGIPDEAESLALIVTDPDAPAGIWTHWIVFNIPPGSDEIDEDNMPDGAVQGVNDFGNTNWGGPCPGSGEHRYSFKVYALDMMLVLPEGANREAVESAMDGHILDQTELIGLYSRN